MEKRDLTGILFKNDRKEKDTHPDYTGNATIAGVDYWMSAWIKQGQKGKFMSFAFKPKEATGHSGRDYVQPKGANEDMDDEIPF